MYDELLVHRFREKSARLGQRELTVHATIVR